MVGHGKHGRGDLSYRGIRVRGQCPDNERSSRLNLQVYSFRHWQAALRVGATNDASRLDATTRKEARKNVAPMMTARRENLSGHVFTVRRDRRDFWSASHLTAHHNQRLVQQSTFG